MTGTDREKQLAPDGGQAPAVAGHSDATAVGRRSRIRALPHGKELLVRVVALLSLAWGAAYFVWRFGWTGEGAQPVLYVILLAAELLGFVNLAFYAFMAWRVPESSPAPVTTVRSVDVLVATFDESVEVLRATLLGCRAIRHPHRTWLLDDGRRTDMRDLANELGVEYVTRPDNSHAKAGNINHALPLLDGELVAMLDADHVPLPSMLDDMVGHFDDRGADGKACSSG